MDNKGCCSLGGYLFLRYVFVLDIFCQQLWGFVQLGGVCVPFGHKVGACTCSEICFCIGYILPTIVESSSVGGCLCALRAQGWGLYMFWYMYLATPERQQHQLALAPRNTIQFNYLSFQDFQLTDGCFSTYRRHHCCHHTDHFSSLCQNLPYCTVHSCISLPEVFSILCATGHLQNEPAAEELWPVAALPPQALAALAATHILDTGSHVICKYSEIENLNNFDTSIKRISMTFNPRDQRDPGGPGDPRDTWDPWDPKEPMKPKRPKRPMKPKNHMRPMRHRRPKRPMRPNTTN